jgi:hypothetical protein
MIFYARQFYQPIHQDDEYQKIIIFPISELQARIVANVQNCAQT